jgi:hypothetical protein
VIGFVHRATGQFVARQEVEELLRQRQPTATVAAG